MSQLDLTPEEIRELGLEGAEFGEWVALPRLYKFCAYVSHRALRQEGLYRRQVIFAENRKLAVKYFRELFKIPENKVIHAVRA